MPMTLPGCRIVLVCSVGFSMATSAFAPCVAPDYRLGHVVVDSQSDVLVAVSIRLNDFAPAKLVCLAGALKQRYRDRKSVDVLIFSSPVAAKYYRRYEIEGPRTTNIKTESRIHSRDLH